MSSMAHLVFLLQRCVLQQAFGKQLLPEIALDTRLVETQLNGQLGAIKADGFELLFTILVIENLEIATKTSQHGQIRSTCIQQTLE